MNKKGRALTGFVYVIYFFGLPALLPWLIGVSIAYFSRSRAAPLWVNHAVYQIRSFWLLLVNLGFAFATLKFTEWRTESASILELTILSWIPFILLAGLILWFGGRCLKGLILVIRNRPHANPTAMWW